MMNKSNDEILFELEKWNVNTKEALERFADDTELYVECLQEFVSDQSFENLKECVKNEDYENAFENAHALKGVSGNLSLKPIYEIIGVIVEKLRKNNLTGINEDIEKLMAIKKQFDEIIHN
ncbi:MAG: Hpt domain-containing protein [Clostridia bacterium]